MNCVPLMLGGLAALYAAFTSASLLLSLLCSCPKALPKDATNLLPASCSESLADVSAAAVAADCGDFLVLGGF